MTDPRISSRLSRPPGCRVTLPLAVLALDAAAACSSSGTAFPSGGSSGGTAARLVATSPPAKGDLASLTWDLRVHLASSDYLHGIWHPGTSENPLVSSQRCAQRAGPAHTGGSAPLI